MGEPMSVLFFDHIARMEDFPEAAKRTMGDDSALIDALIGQIQENAIVARDKSLQVGRAIQWLSLALALGLAAATLFWLSPVAK